MKKRILTGALLTACLMGLILYAYWHFDKGYAGKDFAETAWTAMDTNDTDKDMHGMVSRNTNEEYADRLDVNNDIDNNIDNNDGKLNENINYNTNSITNSSTNDNISDDINNNTHDISVIKIDLLGYQTNDIKKAYFDKGNAGDVFEVVNVKSKETVLTGTIDSKKTGDFSQLTECGTYYIEAPFIGRSGQFCIIEDKYASLSVELYQKSLAYANNNQSDFEKRVLILLWILRYADVYTDDEPYSVFATEENTEKKPEYLKECEKAADGLMNQAEKYVSDKAVESNVDYNLNIFANYSCLMAMLYDKMQAYDATLANTYLNEAVRSYNLVEQRKGELLDEAFLFYAASGLYRYTGQSKYRIVVEEYLENNPERELFLSNASTEELQSDEAYVHGLVSYLRTTNPVDMDLCEKGMKHLMRTAEQFDESIQSENYDGIGNDCRSRILTDRLSVIAIVEHVIVSQEYNRILKNAIHGFSGCNKEGKIYLTDRGIIHEGVDEAQSDALNASAYFYLLGQITESDYKEKESIKSEALESEEQ